MHRMPAPGRPRRRRWLPLLAAATVAVGSAALAGCPGQSQQSGVAPQRATPRPPFALDSAWIVNHPDSVLRFVGSLQFDSVGLADHRRLMKRVNGSLVLGPEAILAPENGAWSIKGNWATEGRILARVKVVGSSYPKLDLEQGVNYIGVRRTPGRVYTGYVISVGSGTGTVLGVRTFRVDFIPRAHPEARFIYDPNDENMCFPCNTAWCCNHGS